LLCDSIAIGPSTTGTSFMIQWVRGEERGQTASLSSALLAALHCNAPENYNH
jgi:hypothetical protein